MAVTDAAPPTRPSLLRRLGDWALTALAAAGALCIIAVIAAFAFNITLIMFSTGSMSPTIPSGSVAVVQEIPATEISVGDVVTVERPNAMPITHRVTEILDTSGNEVTFTMQGDANADPDPAPYTTDTVRLVLFSVPGVATAISRLQDPVVLGVITVLAAALVTWAFWPRGSQAGGPPSGDQPSAKDGTAAAEPEQPSPAAAVTARRRRR